MRVLGHKKAPYSVLKTLNTRETIQINGPIDLSVKPDITCETVRMEFVKNGFEVDIKGVVKIKDEILFETHKTFLYRISKSNSEKRIDSELKKIVKDKPIAHFKISGGAGLKFGFLSGDTNPIHYLPPLAKVQGFKRDFAQPILTIESCFHRIQKEGILKIYENAPYEVEINYKGPVYYDTKHTLISEKSDLGHRFDLFSGDAKRPAH